MIITTHIFLLAALPLGYFAVWHLAKTSRQRVALLALLSIGFYIWAASYYVLLLLTTVALTWRLALGGRTRLGILLNLLPLITYKLLASNITTVSTFNGDAGILIPLGISYFTFKHIGYLVDVEQQRIPATRDLVEFLAFSSFFAQIVSGPISSFAEFRPQLTALDQRPASSKISIALAFIIFGLAKKLLISDVLARYAATQLLAMETPGILWSWGMLVVFVLDIYFNFTGYTDLALGIGMLFGLQLPPNFDAPFLATSARDFWNRWHMSLSFWFRTYVYFPLSRGIVRRYGRENSEHAEYITAFATMFLIGIWHSFSLGFVLWGLYNGFLLSLQSWGERRRISLAPVWAVRLMVIVSLLIGFGFLIQPDISASIPFWAGLLGAYGWGSLSIEPVTLVSLLMGLGLTLSGNSEASRIEWVLSPGQALALGLLAALCILFLGRETIAFAYANF